MVGQKKVEVQIGTKTVVAVVRELTVRQWKTASEEIFKIVLPGDPTPPPKDDKEGKPGIAVEPQGSAGLKVLLELFVDGVSLNDIEDMYPSEVQKLFTAFMDVNAVFFGAMQRIEGENPLIIHARRIILSDLINRFASSSRKDIQMPGITDTASSLQPSSQLEQE